MSAAMVLSFDFELAWGNRRLGKTVDAARFARVHEVVLSLLQTFSEYELPATWATVGHLMLRKEDCRGEVFPLDVSPPSFRGYPSGWYDGIPAPDAAEAHAFYAPRSVRAILDSPVEHEIACHTFTHVPIGDAGCSEATAAGELELCRRSAERWGLELGSFVFPRNIVGRLGLLASAGFRCYRAANSEWYWFGHAHEIYRRRPLRYPVWCLRFLDEWLAVAPPLPPVRRRNELWEIPHSMFFPGRSGVSKWVPLERQVQRAVRGLERAAQRQRVFSLWTHPQNFLTDSRAALAAFGRICAAAARLREQGHLEVLTMRQVADRMDAGERPSWSEP